MTRYAIRKLRGQWTVCFDKNIVLQFENYNEALSTARGAIEVLAERETRITSLHQSDAQKSAEMAATEVALCQSETLDDLSCFARRTSLLRSTQIVELNMPKPCLNCGKRMTFARYAELPAGQSQEVWECWLCKIIATEPAAPAARSGLGH